MNQLVNESTRNVKNEVEKRESYTYNALQTMSWFKRSKLSTTFLPNPSYLADKALGEAKFDY